MMIYGSVDSTPRVPPNTSLKKWLSFLMEFRPNRYSHAWSVQRNSKRQSTKS